jgi:tetratricopeptide (TPR) repeat protein
LLRSTPDWGILYRYSRRTFGEAEERFKRALAINEKALGEEHHNVARDLRNLGMLYRRWRPPRLEEAEQVLQRALAIDEKVQEEGHLDISSDLNYLGDVYRLQGKFAESEETLNRALALREEALGPDGYDVTLTLDHIANLYKTQGRHADAEQVHRRVLAIYEKTLDLPNQDRSGILEDMEYTLEDLADVLHLLGRDVESFQMRTRAEEVRTQQSQESRR